MTRMDHKMDLHDYDKANDIRKMIKSVTEQIKSLESIEGVTLVDKKNKNSKAVRDFKRTIADKRCCKEIDNAQHTLVDNLRKALQNYIVRLENQFDQI